MKNRRWLSILLSISIIVCLLPTVVSADGLTWSDLQSQITNARGDVIDLGSGYISAQNEDYALVVPAEASVTLEMNGAELDRFAYSGARDNGNVFVVYGELTLSGKGLITGGRTTGNGAGIYIARGGKVTINSNDSDSSNSSSRIRILNNISQSNGGGIYVSSGASLEINGGYVSSGVMGGGHGGGIFVEEGASFSVSGPTSISGYNYETDQSSPSTPDGVYLSAGTRINITGIITNSTINVNVSEDHDKVITSSLGNNGNPWHFQSDYIHDYNVQLNSAGEAYLRRRIWHTITVTSPDPHGSITQSKVEYEVGVDYPSLTANAEEGYCLSSLKEVGVSDPVPINRYHRQLNPYVVNCMPDRDMTVEAVWTPIADTVIVKSAYLTLSGKISINIKMQVPAAIANDPGAKVQISYRGESRQVALTSLPQEGGLYVVTQPCAVREFACPVAVRVLNGNGETCIMTSESTKNICINEEDTYAWVNGEYVSVSNPDGTLNNHILNEFTYTIENYKNAVKKGNDTSLQRLIESLNYYCNDAWAFFQAYRGIQDHSFVDYDYTPSYSYQNKFNAVTVDSLENYKPTVEGSIKGITVKDMRLTLDSDTMITVRFDLHDAVNRDDILVMCPNINPSVEISGNTLTVKIKNINALNLDHTYAINVYYGREVLTFNCSALSYAYIVLSNEANQPASYRTQILDLVRSLTVYSNEAHRYYD